MMNFGQKIRQKRMEKNLKVYELADKVGVNPVYITQIEKHNKLPSILKAQEICKVLDCDNLIDLYLTDRKKKLEESVAKTVTTLSLNVHKNLKSR